MPMDFQDLHSYARLLSDFNTHNFLRQGKQLHQLFLKNGVLLSTLSIANRVLQMYVRCGKTEDACNLFDEIPQRNPFTWNTILEGYAKSGRKNEMLAAFNAMPDRNEFSWNVVLSGLVGAGELNGAHSLFNEMPRKNELAWNTMINGYARSGEPGTALRLFKECLNWETVETDGVLSRNPFVLATVIGACAECGGLDWGKQVHGRMIVGHVEFDLVLGSSLVNMYGKCGDLDSASSFLSMMDYPDNFSLSSLISGYANCGRMSEARRIFDELKSDPCVVLWNSMISGYVANGEPFEALALFDCMQTRGLFGDASTFSSILRACSSLGTHNICTQLHAQVHKLGFLQDLVVASALVDTYAKCGTHSDACSLFGELETHDTVLLNTMVTIYCSCGRIEEAKSIFNNMKSKSLISWNSMIVGLSQNGCTIEVLYLFSTMNKNNLKMDKFSLASAISACASIPSQEFGEQLFGRATVIGLDLDQVVATSLIDLYCKCGFVDAGRKLFDQMIKTDEVSWNSMLTGYATNGYAVEALTLFQEMRRGGIPPNEVTFTSVLSACNHCGFLEEGKKLFSIMKNEYHIDPGIEHYSCMVDLLARAGCLQEAIDLIDQMPSKSDANMWSAILRGCILKGDKTLSNKVTEKIVELDPQNASAFVQLSGLLASGGDWEKSAMLRQWMKETGIQKSPGRSWCNI